MVSTTEPSLPAGDVPKVWRNTLVGLMIAFFLFWFIIPLAIPGSSHIIQIVTLPFLQLGIFVHEMGHGLFALLSGGRFHWFQMELFSGVAITSGGWSIFRLLGGLLGPALCGALLLQASTRAKNLSWAFGSLVLFFVVGAFFMIKPLFMSAENTPLLQSWSMSHLLSLVVPGCAAVLTWFVWRGGESAQRFYLQVLGIVMCYAAFSDTHYIFHYEVLGNGLYSDARVFASLFIPGGPENVPKLIFTISSAGIAIMNFGLLFWGAYKALRH